MKRIFLLNTLLVVLLASCSTQYKSTQTPDDVYYSPLPAASVAQEKKEEDKKQDKYEEYTNTEDRYLRMKVANRNRWSTIDDYSYWYDTRYNDYYNYNNYNSGLSVSYGYNHYACSCYGSNSIFYTGYYNPYVSSYSNNYYNGYPVYGGVFYIPKPIHSNVNRPQLGAYSNGNYSNTINNSTGNSIKKIFSSGSRSINNTDTYRSTDRTYTPSPSSSSSSSGSSSSSSSGSTSRPGRH